MASDLYGDNEPLRRIRRSGPGNEKRDYSLMLHFIERFFGIYLPPGIAFSLFTSLRSAGNGLATVRLSSRGDARTGGVVPPYFGGVHRHGLAAGP